MFKTEFENLRRTCPLIHNITNYVTVNDCANMVLACGASPIMADDAAEVEDITTICGGLNINIGTLNSRTITSMLLAGKKANQLGHPVVLDPVGAGASRLRTDTAYRLLRDVKFAVIRGNISEIKTLASGAGTTKGVDADVADKVTEENLDSAVAFAKKFAAQTGAVIAITGAIDIVADAQKAYVIRNGNPMMSASPAPDASSRPSRRLSLPPTPAIRWKLLQPQCAPWALRARSPTSGSPRRTATPPTAATSSMPFTI